MKKTGIRRLTILHFLSFMGLLGILVPEEVPTQVVIPGGWSEEQSARFEEAGIEANQKNNKLVFNLSPADLKKHRELVVTVIRKVVIAQNS